MRTQFEHIRRQGSAGVGVHTGDKSFASFFELWLTVSFLV